MKVHLGMICAVICAPFLVGCATIASGNTQMVYFDSAPTGADCKVSREGIVLHAFTTPSTLEIERDKDPITTTCDLEGYETSVLTSDSNLETMAVGNILIGGIIGVGVDAASGALNEYPSQIIVPMTKSRNAPQGRDTSKPQAFLWRPNSE